MQEENNLVFHTLKARDVLSSKELCAGNIPSDQLRPAHTDRGHNKSVKAQDETTFEV